MQLLAFALNQELLLLKKMQIQIFGYIIIHKFIVIQTQFLVKLKKIIFLQIFIIWCKN